MTRYRPLPYLAVFLASALVSACGGGGSGITSTGAAALATATASAAASAGTSTSASMPYTCPTAMTSSGMLDCTKLPIGDQRYSTTAPAAGSVYLCSAPSAGNPVVSAAPWLDNTDKTWNVTQKVAVMGAVPWAGSFSATTSSDGATRTIAANGLPISPYTTGTFPIASSDPAYTYDQNPNSIASQTFSFAVAVNPVANATPTCLPAGGPIGITTTGVAIYNAFDAAGYDGVAREVQDACHGHPDPSSTYHYHGFIQTCSGDTGSATQDSSLIGYSLDGFGIYGPWYHGKVLTTADLDACHGTTSAVMWNGTVTTIYHYVSTYDFPYTIGCYRGTPVRA
jgi:hypothetical protein